MSINEPQADREILENLFPILFRAYNRSMRITNIDLGLTQIHTDAKVFIWLAIKKIRDSGNNFHIYAKFFHVF